MEVQWSADAARQLAELEMLLGRLGPAERLLQEALKRDGPSTRTLTLMGRLLLTGGHHSRAQRFLQRAVKMAPASQLARRPLGAD